MPRTVSNERFGSAPDFRISDTGAQMQSAPVLAALAGGGFISVWMNQNFGSPSVRAQIFDDNGREVGAEFAIGASSAIEPSVAALPSGGFVVTWGEESPYPAVFDVKGRIFDAGGAPIGAEFTVNTTTNGFQVSSEVTALAGGGFVATWVQRNDGTFDNIRGQVFAADGSKIGGEFIANDALSGTKEEATVVGLAGGGFVIAWSQAGAESTGGGNLSSGSRAQLFDASGSKVGSAFSLNTIVPGVQQNPDLAALPGGGFVAAWSDNGNPSTPDPHPENKGIWVQMFDAAGAKAGAAIHVSTLGPDGADSPDVEIIPGTGFIVMWRDFNATAENPVLGHLRAQVFDFAGNKSGEEFAVNPGLNAAQLQGDLIVLANGALVVGWTNRAAPQFNDDDVRARMFFPTVIGTDGNDIFAGTANRDFYLGKGGDDQVSGGAEDDGLAGDLGNDMLNGGAGADQLDGGEGDDILISLDASNLVAPYDGLVSLDAGTDRDVLIGGAGDDRFAAGFGDEVSGGAGINRLSINFLGAISGVNADFRIVQSGGTIVVGGGAISGIAETVDIQGSAFDDVISAMAGASALRGNGGNDRLAGGDGADTIDGDAGNDILHSAALSPGWQQVFFGYNPDLPPPVLDTGAEIDVLRGGGGHDTILAGYGDFVDGGADGADLLISLQGASAGVTADFRALAGGGSLVLGGGTIANILGVLWIEGSEHDDTLTGSDVLGYLNSGNGPIFGRGGNDHLIAGAATGNIYGGTGDDVIDSARVGAHYYHGDEGDDVITVTHVDGYQTQSFGGDGNDTLNVTGSAHGGAGDDVITLTSPGFSGLVGNGGDGNDTLNGSGTGNQLAGGNGVDLLYGNAGNDLLYSAGPADGLSPNFSPNGPLDGEADAGTEHDQLFGGANDDRLSIGYGDDADGGAGTNILALSLLGAGAGVSLDTAGIIAGGAYALGGGVIQNVQSIQILWGSGFGDTITLAEQATGLIVYGEGGDDVINATAKADSIHGGAGADVINAGGGDDIIYIDAAGEVGAGEQINGGAGFDTIRTAMHVETDLTGAILTGIESIVSGASTVISTTTLATIGSASGNFRFANGGVVSLGAVTAAGSLFFVLSEAGNEIDVTGVQATGFLQVFGGGGDDLITGPATGGSTSGGGGNDVLNGGAGLDQLFGEDGNDRLDGRGGNDHMRGGLGDDIYFLDAGGDRVFENSGEGNDTIVSLVTVSSANSANVETIVLGGAAAIDATGSGNANVLIGNAAVNRLNGLGGNDLLDGGAGADIMSGGTGNDTYVVDEGGDQVTETAGGGRDVVYARANYTLAAGAEVEVLSVISQGAGTRIDLTGNELAQELYGNTEANFLDGGGGADYMAGFGGDDIYVVDQGGDVIAEAAGEGRDVVYARANYTLNAGAAVEILSVISQGTGTRIDLTGNEFAQELYGNTEGNFLDGGGGADYMAGFGGDDIYVVDQGGDVIAEAAGEGRDVVYARASYTLNAGAAVEVLSVISQGGGTVIDLTGNELVNELYGNTEANFLDGGGGADYMQGFGGNDNYVVETQGDFVAEGVGEGNHDVVYARASYALAAGQEIEVLSAQSQGATSALDLSGNEFANELYGNDGVNVLNGGAGGDYLVGYGGADRFAFTTALAGGNIDQIADFLSGTDGIQLDDAVFTGLGLGALNADAFVVGTAAQDADDRIVYDQATGALWFDADGSGAGAAVQFATLIGHPPIAAGDFTVI
jgi:Ca2+-binding RTX toxin-like protein